MRYGRIWQVRLIWIKWTQVDATNFKLRQTSTRLPILLTFPSDPFFQLIFCRVDKDIDVLLAHVFLIENVAETVNHGCVDIASSLVGKYDGNQNCFSLAISIAKSLIYYIPVLAWPSKFSMRRNWLENCCLHWRCAIQIPWKRSNPFRLNWLISNSASHQHNSNGIRYFDAMFIR